MSDILKVKNINNWTIVSLHIYIYQLDNVCLVLDDRNNRLSIEDYDIVEDILLDDVLQISQVIASIDDAVTLYDKKILKIMSMELLLKQILSDYTSIGFRGVADNYIKRASVAVSICSAFKLKKTVDEDLCAIFDDMIMLLLRNIMSLVHRLSKPKEKNDD